MTPTDLLTAAYEQAMLSASLGGLPIGSVLADADGRIVARGHNRRFLDGDVTAHAETVCMRRAGIREDWGRCTLVSTLSPCIMCTGAALLFRIPRIIAGENITFTGAERLFQEAGVELTIMQDERCIAMMAAFIQDHPEKWWGDIGIPPEAWPQEEANWRQMMRDKGYGKYVRG